MQESEKRPEHLTPAEIAREAFRRLGARRVAPTPEAYRDVYEEIAGLKGRPSSETILADLANSLEKGSDEVARSAPRLRQALKDRDWELLGTLLNRVLERHLLREPSDREAAQPLAGAVVPVPEHVQAEAVATVLSPLPPGKQARVLRDMLARTLRLPVSTLLHRAPELRAESERLAEVVDAAFTEQSLNEASAGLKQLCFKIELSVGDLAEEQELLVRLFRLLIENVGELVEDDAWLAGQIETVQRLLDGPINYIALTDATRALKEVIYKQSLLKHSLSEAKQTMKNLMLTFLARLDAIATVTGDYRDKVATYSERVNEARHVSQLQEVLEKVLQTTRTVHTEARRSLDDITAAREEAQAAEGRVLQLQSELEQLSELVREDQLTGSLNRRGLDDVLEREMTRAERRKAPLCIAMLDLDDFKRINDSLGHSGGDEALIHLVRVVKDTLRAMDVIGRFGGEEFMIVLPETALDDAVAVVTRVQRELTKQIFMYNNERRLMTFSAGVALRKEGEDRESLVKRADEAAYQAKRAGKNRVIPAL